MSKQCFEVYDGNGARIHPLNDGCCADQLFAYSLAEMTAAFSESKQGVVKRSSSDEVVFSAEDNTFILHGVTSHSTRYRIYERTAKHRVFVLDGQPVEAGETYYCVAWQSQNMAGLGFDYYRDLTNAVKRWDH